jgi:hypothetical protein
MTVPSTEVLGYFQPIPAGSTIQGALYRHQPCLKLTCMRQPQNGAGFRLTYQESPPTGSAHPLPLFVASIFAAGVPLLENRNL